MFNKPEGSSSNSIGKTGKPKTGLLSGFAAVLLMILLLTCTGGCYFNFGTDARQTTKPSQEDTAAADQTEPESTAASSATAAATDSSSAATVTTSAPATPAATTAPATPAVTSAPTAPANTAKMYSSYAILTAFDPSAGVASFDYFDMLKGQEAIDWLVEQEGYTRADAEDEVNNFADSEFVYKNVNPQLRYAGMTLAAIKMMYNPDGSELDNSVSIPFTYQQFCELYSAHPELVVKSPYFYYCTVDNGVITGVEQVYWP